MAFSPDNQTLLTGGWDQTARLWEVASGKPLCPPLPHGAKLEAVAFGDCPGSFWTGTRDGFARLWGAAPPNKPPLRLDGEVLAVAFSPDGQTILTGSALSRSKRTKAESGEIRLWRTDTGESFWRQKQRYPVLAVAFSPDGRTILTGSGTETANKKGEVRL